MQLEQIKLLRNINADGIIDMPKGAETLLQLADLVAHALYKCVDKTYGGLLITEPRYLIEIKDKFYYNPKSLKILGAGIKPVHRIGQLKLDNDIENILMKLEHTNI